MTLYRGASDLAKKILDATAELDELAKQEIELVRSPNLQLAQEVERRRRQLRKKFAELARLCKEAERRAA